MCLCDGEPAWSSKCGLSFCSELGPWSVLLPDLPDEKERLGVDMSDFIESPLLADSPDYLVEAYADYVKAYNGLKEAKKVYDESCEHPFLTEWDKAVKYSSVMEPARQLLGAATVALLTCMADARGSDLYAGCF